MVRAKDSVGKFDIVSEIFSAVEKDVRRDSQGGPDSATQAAQTFISFF
jgi:hypothetical protein